MKSEKILNENIINSDIRIIDALNIIDKIEIKTLLVYHDKKYFGTITDGDIRRGLLENYSLDDNVYDFTNSNSFFIEYENYNKKNNVIFNDKDIIPIIKNHEVYDVLINPSFKKSKSRKSIDSLCEVVIMAGGKGSRMQPLTNLIPKPLIPYKDKTLIEHVMTNFSNYKKTNFTISVNYKSDQIIDYFNKQNTGFVAEYLHEDFPMGTIGALSNLSDKFDKDIFVCNCDSLINLDFYEMLNFHKKNNFDFTIAGCEDIIHIPYGVCTVNEDNSLKVLKEKPQINNLINSGLYLISPSAINLIPKNKEFNATDLISLCQKKGLSVGVYPFSKDLWLDVGLLSDYLALI